MSCKALEFLDINNLPRSRKSKVLKKENSARWCRRKKARVPIAKRCIPDMSQLIKKVSRSNKVGNDDKHVPNDVKSYGVKGDNKIKSNCKKLMMTSFQNDKKTEVIGNNVQQEIRTNDGFSGKNMSVTSKRKIGKKSNKIPFSEQKNRLVVLKNNFLDDEKLVSSDFLDVLIDKMNSLLDNVTLFPPYEFHKLVPRTMMEDRQKYATIVNTDIHKGYHWIVLSNILSNKDNKVIVYDPDANEPNALLQCEGVRKALWNVYKRKAMSNTLEVDVMTLQHQSDDKSCGVFCCLYIALLCQLADPARLSMKNDVLSLRKSIYKSFFENGDPKSLLQFTSKSLTKISTIIEVGKFYFRKFISECKKHGRGVGGSSRRSGGDGGGCGGGGP